MVSRKLGVCIMLGVAGIAGCSEQESQTTASTPAAAEPAMDNSAAAMPEKDLKSSLVFHASWDNSLDADFAKGDPKIYTAETVKHEKQTQGANADQVSLVANGRFGGAAQFNFADNSDPVEMYRGKDNMGYKAEDFDVTISFWMQTDQANLPPEYIDPFQVYDRDWNDGAIWVDFPKNPPAPAHRQFRLAVPSDASHWNPDNTHINAMPRERQPMTIVENHPFQDGQWHHIAMVLENLNSSDGISQARLYIDGELQGLFEKDIRITWNEDNVAMMVGIKYVGLLDDLAVFDKALSRKELATLIGLEGGVKSL